MTMEHGTVARGIRGFVLRASLIGLAAASTPAARAAESPAEQAQRWHDLKQMIFGDRPVLEGSDLVTLDAPDRALDASLVPIGVTISSALAAQNRDVKALYVLVDANPAPLVGTFRFSPEADPHRLKTRVRVDQYTMIHAVVEMADGRLVAAGHYVKAAGGCSAPSLKDPQLALERLGKMKLRFEGTETLEPGKPATIQILVSHPNANGMQVDQVSHNFIPARFIQTLNIAYAGRPLMSLEADISLSEDPAISFAFTPHGAGALSVDVTDSTATKFHQEFSLPMAETAGAEPGARRLDQDGKAL